MSRGAVLIALLLATISAGRAPGVAPGSVARGAETSRQARTLSIVIRVEPASVSEGRGGVSQNHMGAALFTAGMSRTNAQETPYPVTGPSPS